MILLTLEEFDAYEGLIEKHGKIIRDIAKKDYKQKNAKEGALIRAWEKRFNEIYDLINEPLRKTVERMTLEQVYDDAFITVHYWAAKDLPIDSRFNALYNGEISMFLEYHLNALHDAGEYEKEQYILDLVEQKKNETLDPDLVKEYGAFDFFMIEVDEGTVI